jgi:hypothetical protein
MRGRDSEMDTSKRHEFRIGYSHLSLRQLKTTFQSFDDIGIVEVKIEPVAEMYAILSTRPLAMHEKDRIRQVREAERNKGFDQPCRGSPMTRPKKCGSTNIKPQSRNRDFESPILRAEWARREGLKTKQGYEPNNSNPTKAVPKSTTESLGNDSSWQMCSDDETLCSDEETFCDRKAQRS